MHCHLTHTGSRGNLRQICQVFVETSESVSKIGYQWSKDTGQGPLVSKAQHERVLEYLSIGKTEGAVIATGGHAVTVGTEGKGFWVAPTVFNDVKPSMRVFQEEIFGPVAVIAKFKTEDEAIALAKNTKYGLGSALFTTDLERAHRVAQEIEAGMVWVNSSQDCDPRVPFGGVKQSDIGRELGEAGLEAYT